MTDHLFRAGQSLISLVERTAGVRVFTIANAMRSRFEDLTALHGDVSSWPVPSIALIRGTALNAKQLTHYDAVLYLGPPSAITFSRLSPSLCADPAYMDMRMKRVALTSGLQRLSEELKEHCTSVTTPPK